MSEHDQFPPPQPHKKHTALLVVVAVISLLVGLSAILFLIVSLSSQTSSDTLNAQATQAAQDEKAIQQDNATLTAIVGTPPMSEQAYKANTTSTTVATLDKDGNVDKGKDVHFTCTIIDFVKDANGNTGGANVEDPNTSGVVQIVFPATTDLSKVNTDDALEVWGTDDGTSSGPNAYGATVQEVGVSAAYMTDHTTGYTAK
jgi:type II secretory pathway pseudopilin PulG